MQKIVAIGASILWIFIILTLCAIPSDSIPDPKFDIPHLDKVVHFGMFFIMSLILSYTLESWGFSSLMRIYTFAITVSILYGGIIEILQHYYFNRGGDVLDLVADITGGIAGCICYPLAKRILRI